MIQFTYTDNSEAVDKALANFQSSLADEAPALQAIADDFRAMIAAAILPAKAARKARRGRRGNDLV